MPRPAVSIIWKSLFPEEYCWCAGDQDENVALFHPCSGNILLVTPLAEFLLKSIQQQPASEAELIESTSRFFELETNDNLKRAIGRSLRTFYQHGLISKIQS